MLRSLRSQLALVALLAIIPSFVLALYLTMQERIVDNRHAAAGLDLEGVLVARAVEGNIDAADCVLRALCASSDVRDMSPKGAHAYLNAVTRGHRDYVSLTVAWPSGDVFASAPPLGKPLNCGDRPSFQLARATGRPVLGGMKASHTTDKMVIPYHYPLKDDSGRVVMVAAAIIDAGEIGTALSPSARSQGARVQMVNGAGETLAEYPASSMPVADVRAQRRLRAAIASLPNAGGTTEITGSDGEPWMVAIRPMTTRVQAERTYIAVSLPVNAVLADGRRHLRNTALILALIGVFGGASLWLTTGRLVLRPVSNIARSASAFGDEDSEFVSAGGPYISEEFESLARTFDSMATEVDSQRRLIAQAERVAHIGPWRIDLQTKQVTGSGETMAILGLDGPIEYGRARTTFLGLVHPDDRPLADAAIDALMGGGPDLSLDLRLLAPGGEVKWIQLCGVRELDAAGEIAAIVGIVQDITGRKSADIAVKEYADRLSAMAESLCTTGERERQRLAEELHDRVCQPLAVAKMTLSSALADATLDDHQQVDMASSLLDDAIRQTRTITSELAPSILFEIGLCPALRAQCDELEGLYGLRVDVSVDDDDLALEDDLKLTVYRAARELLVNVVRHAGVLEAWLTVEHSAGWLEMTVGDEGCGFMQNDPEGAYVDKGFGLLSIRERLAHVGGEYDIESGIGEGTRVTLRFPVSRRGESEGDASDDEE